MSYFLLESMGKNKESDSSGNLQNEQRKSICEYYATNPNVTQKELAEWAKKKFNLAKAPAQSTISAILKRKVELSTMLASDLTLKKRRVMAFSDLDSALANWVLQCEHKGIRLSGDLIKAKAKKFADMLKIPENEQLNFSNGWLQSFQERYTLKHFKLHGESGSADIDAINVSLPDIIRTTNKYCLSDIYNMDETGLFYRMTPDRTIASRQIEGSKKDKIRITIALTTNADGTDKLEPFFIGHATMPRCFQKKTAEQLGFYYRNNKKAWMTGLLFREWLQKFNTHVRTQKRRVLLIVDNAPSHTLGDLQLTNIEVLFLPPNATSKIQPMDAGVIAAFKRRYRNIQLQHAIDRDEAGERDIYKVDQLQGMRWVKIAWSEVTPETIKNCWNHTNILSSSNGVETSAAEDPSPTRDDTPILSAEEAAVENELTTQMRTLRVQDPMAIKDLVNPEDEEKVHQEFTDEDLIQSGIEAEEAEEEGGEAEPTMTGKEQLAVLRDALKIVDEKIDDNGVTMRSLRKLQSRIREEVRKEEAEKQIQRSLEFFFSKN